MKMSKKIIAVSLVVSLVMALFLPVGAFAGQVSYDITSPYETVDWDNWNQYQAQLHTHTLYSDGTVDVKDVVERYYELGYDILAVTDHGVVNKGWNRVPEVLDLIGYNQYINDFEPMSQERYEEITIEGAGRDGRPMLDVPYGIELNALVVRKNHVNGFFVDYGNGILGQEEDYETVIAGNSAAGGITFINHPGDFIAANKENGRAEDYDQLKVFIDPLMKYDSCVGIEIFNLRDTTDRADRILWDTLLQYTIPQGKNVWGFSNDDSHALDDIDVTREIMLMPELSNDALRTAMENGTFFACSRYARYEMGEDFVGEGEYASIHSLNVDDDNDTITVVASNYDVIEWIADGEIIATGETLDLREYSDEIGCYVRFQIKNEGGIVCSQPFVCDDGDMTDEAVEYPEEHVPNNIIAAFFQELLDMLRRTLIGEVIYDALFL
ncbi:MAG: PHP domain-containing protein [Clostridia bacterium]|nr:PHP domain-containing protein [Clostridia bacterium]